MPHIPTLATIVPEILQDEFIDRYRGRIAGWNGVESSECVTKLLCDYVTEQGLAGTRPASFLEAAALVNRLTLDQLVSRHSCYAISNKVGCRPSLRDPVQRAIRHVKFTILHRRAARMSLCWQCVQEDLARFHFSYWRRRHQITGQISCHVHGCGLQFIDRIDDIALSPAAAAQYAQKLSADRLRRLRSNAFITRFIEILDSIVEKDLVLDLQGCQSAFRAGVLARGENPSAPRWFANFSQEIDSAFDSEWLASTFRRSKFRPGEIRSFAIAAFGGQKVALSHSAVAIVASVLFPSAQTAIGALVRKRELAGSGAET